MACGDMVRGPRSCARSPSGTAPCPATAVAAASANTKARIRTLRFDHISVEFECQLKICRFVARECDRILTGITGGAIGGAPRADRGQEAFEAEIAHAVCANVFLNFFERVGCGNQLRSARRIDTV